MSTQTEIAIRPLTSFLGAEIEGVDASSAISTDLLTQLNDALIEHQLLVLRNQALTVEQQIAFSANFGELEQFSPHPNYPQHREIFPVSNREEEGYLNVGHYWHHDGSFLETPTRLSLFYFLKAPVEGGDFLFTNMYLAYETLPEKLKQQVESLETIHRVSLSINLFLLMCIAFIPCSTAIVGKYSQFPIVVSFYGLSLAITGLVYNALWFYVLNRYIKSENSIQRHSIRQASIWSISYPICYFGSALLALVNSPLSLFLDAAISLFYLLPGVIDRQLTSFDLELATEEAKES